MKIISKYSKIDEKKFKTELCKEFQLNNICRYGMKCKFAHGRD